MKSAGATALLTLAILTGCLGARSDQSRSRSSRVRSAPVAAEIKRDTDFECPEEFGYYPHPTDCTFYYVCVFGGALLESCTGGLMYSHELQTCDWPRNVGCDGTSVVGEEKLERLSEREPPPPPRRAPLPPPRVQPNPVVTSRGQPKFNRQEYEKQQQLYAEVDDLPTFEELETDRQQRVYRGQPPTIGQVQKDRDGYVSQSISSARNLNSNIIPASLSQNSKIGSFSFGSQVDERRTATVTSAPQSYSLEPTESVSPASYSASPRPKMLYNGSQSYSPDQYDPFYAVYDEDGELYKDADYVQQYNQASLRPAVQQTYRGTPPPARRPVQTYTPRPSADDYDDALIQPQISNQNQYQAPIRHSPRGEGNELGYDHISSSVKTTLYEATSISTPPRTTTSTSTTTTKRPTTAPYTEAMTPRYTPRSSTDENSNPQSSSSKPSDESSSSIPSTLSPVISVSSLAKPFQLTDNSHRLENTISSTEKLLTAKDSSQVTNNDKLSVEVVRPKSGNDKKVVTLTSGFSFRRNSNNTNNPYTLTVLTRPFNDYDKPRRENSRNITNRRVHLDRHIYDSSSTNAPIQSTNSSTLSEVPSEIPIRRKTTTPKISEDYDISVHIRPTSRLRTNKPRIKINNLPTSTSSISKNKKYNINTSRQSTLSFNSHEGITDSTENSINTEVLIEAGLQTVRDTDASKELTRNDYSRSHNYYTELVPLVSPYKTLDNLRNIHKKEDNFYNPSTSTSPTVQYTVKPIRAHNIKKEKILRTEQPSYHSYHIDDEVVPNHTTEIFNDKVKNVIRTFLSNIITASVPEQSTEELTTISNIKSTTPLQKIEDDIINIGYQKKTIKHSNEKPKRISVKRLQIITEPPLNRDVIPEANINDFTDLDIDSKDFLSTSTTMASLNSSPFTYISSTSIPYSVQSSTGGFNNVSGDDVYQSKYTSLFISKPNNENSQKFMKLINDSYVIQSSSNSIIEPTKTAAEDIQTTTMNTRHGFSNLENDIVSTTSTTKATMTHRFEASTTTTKSISFPTRASRVNPAIKLAATNPGSGRRSYQSPSNCSTDNSLQANPKCNEIKYQRYSLLAD